LSEHLSSEQLERFNERKLSAAELNWLFDHASVCLSCRQQLGPFQQAQATFAELRSALRNDAREPLTHLRYDQLAAYLDRSADETEREIIESHLEICASCTADAQDLRVFQADMPSSEVKPAVGEPSGFWEKIKALWQRPSFRIPLQLAGATMVVLVVVWVATLPLRRQVAELRAQLDAAQQKNDELRQQSASTEQLKSQLAELQQSQLSLRNPNAQELSDGGRVVAVDMQGHVTGMEPLPPPVELAVKAALVNADQSSELRSLVGKAGTLMGGGSKGVSFGLLSPIGTFVESDRPTFRWQPVKGAAGYAVNIIDSHFNNVATSGRLSDTEWTAQQPLKRDELYSWQVTAIKDGQEIISPVPPAPEARFKVLESSKAESLSRARTSYPHSHLILGALYRQAGLLDAAEREFKELLAANPTSAAARKLLEGVRSLRQK